MTKTIKLLFFVVFVIATSAANAQWKVDGTIATETRIFSDVGEYKYMMFGVDWDRKSQCKPVINLFVMKKPVLGKFKSVTRSSERMTVTIDGEKWSGDTILTSHENGNSAMFYASSDLVNKIQRARDIYVQLFKGGMVVVFDGRGSSSAISEAKRNCKP